MSMILAVFLAAQSEARDSLPLAEKQRLERASNEGDLKVVDDILTAHPEWVDAANDQGVSFMLSALYRHRTEVVEAYVRRRKAFNLFEASALGRSGDIEALLTRDPAAVKSYSGDGFTPLALAAFFARPEALRVLLAHGADVSQYGRTLHVQPLHSAAAGRCLECVRLLLEAGADPNAPQDEGFRAIHEAAASGDRPMTELLVGRGALAGLRNDKGRTAADLAREAGHLEIAVWLESITK
jgi:ankyrin repeat protein